MKRLTWGLVLALSLALAACGGKKSAEAPPDESDEIECETHADCDGNLQCLGNECVDTSSKAIYTDPSNAVTPDKMKREVELRQKAHTERVDKALEIGQ